MRRLRRFLQCSAIAISVAVCALSPAPVSAATVHVAVAANFTQAAKSIGDLFRQKTRHNALFSFGATGQLFTQITQDAPFEVFLAADQARPERAVAKGFAVAGSRFTYATGRIVLYSPDPARIHGAATLKDGRFMKIAIANPVTAPYGAAAVAAMKALGIYDTLRGKVVQGNSIAQTYQFVATGNAELGFVALSQIAGHDRGSRWLVPQDLYPVIAQDAVLLKRGAGNEAATAFLAFLKSDAARAVIRKFGYGTGD